MPSFTTTWPRSSSGGRAGGNTRRVASAPGRHGPGAWQRPLEPDPELARACAEALDRARLPVSRIRAYKEGGEARVALGFRRHADRQQREEAVRVLSAELGLTLRLSPERGRRDELLLCPATRYQLLVGACRRASAEGNGSCGDNHIFRELPGGQYMLAISDGHGPWLQGLRRIPGGGGAAGGLSGGRL